VIVAGSITVADGPNLKISVNHVKIIIIGLIVGLKMVVFFQRTIIKTLIASVKNHSPIALNKTGPANGRKK
jgi:hypothetical protein